MDIKFIRGAYHLGYAYKAGMTAGLSDEVAQYLIDAGVAVLNQTKRRKEHEPEVKTTQVMRTRKRPV